MSLATRMVQCQQRARALMHKVADYREQWLHKQIHVEQVDQKLHAVCQELHERLETTRCGCNHPACSRCRDDAETERVIAECCKEESA